MADKMKNTWPTALAVALATFAAFGADGYIVIDLSGGKDAAKYPISRLDVKPTGGWTDEYKTSKLVMREVPAGKFAMGGKYGVTLTKPFLVGVFEVTQRQYELVTGERPSFFTNASCYATRPVETVSYDKIRGSSAGAGWPASSAVDATSFLGLLRARTGLDGLDLPTEAQWEYACRAGTTTHYNSGRNYVGEGLERDAAMDEVGRYWYNGGEGSDQGCTTKHGTAAVGSYRPNAWGLYDMHGNAWEWCLDWHGDLADGATDPVGSHTVTHRLVRGGSWVIKRAEYCSSGSRHRASPSIGRFRGFRLVLNSK